MDCIILFYAVLAMWKQQKRDRHCCENGNDISVKTKLDCRIKNLYGNKNLVMHDDVDT